MKKLFKLIGLVVMVFALFVQTVDAGVIVSNLVAGTNVIRSQYGRVNQITLVGTLANYVRFTDSSSPSNSYYQNAYSYGTNYAISITNVQTNGVFVDTDYLGRPTATNYLRQTNVLVGIYSTNVAVAAGVAEYPNVYAVYAPAATLTSSGTIDLTFARGITVINTNSVTVIVYTTP